MALSKRLRFEIFKRDGFRCVYCGANPTEKPLRVEGEGQAAGDGMEVDHVEPRAGGGSDDAANLVTACADCNRGKSAVRLDARALPERMSAEASREQAEQIRAYLAAQRDVVAARRESVGALLDVWEPAFGKAQARFVARFRNVLPLFPLERLVVALERASERCPRRPDEAMRYFNGILRAWRQGGDDSDYEGEAIWVADTVFNGKVAGKALRPSFVACCFAGHYDVVETVRIGAFPCPTCGAERKVGALDAVIGYLWTGGYSEGMKEGEDYGRYRALHPAGEDDAL